jgi:hypothetical protein
VRNFSAHSNAKVAAKPETKTEVHHPSADAIIVPELFATLEWTLSSPMPIHQFVEPPVKN